MNLLVQSFDEFYELADNFLDASDFTGTADDEELDYLLAIILVLFHDFYDAHKYDNVDDVLGADFKNDIEQLRLDLINDLNFGVEDYVSHLKSLYDSKYNVEDSSKLVFDEYKPVLDSMVDAMIYQLYYDAYAKAQYYSSMMGAFAKDYNLNSNFRRFVERFKKGFNNNFQAIKGGVERKFLEFVYGEDHLFYWVPSGRNTCEWCYMLADMSPLPLKAFPKDHPNGACRLVPIEDYYDEFGGLV